MFDLFALKGTTLCGSSLIYECIDKITVHYDCRLWSLCVCERDTISKTESRSLTLSLIEEEDILQTWLSRLTNTATSFVRVRNSPRQALSADDTYRRTISTRTQSAVSEYLSGFLLFHVRRRNDLRTSKNVPDDTYINRIPRLCSLYRSSGCLYPDVL